MSAVLLGLIAALSWSIHDLLVRKFAPSLGAFKLAFTIMWAGALLLVGFPLLPELASLSGWPTVIIFQAMHADGHTIY